MKHRCPLCDEVYDTNSDRAKMHEHPEPQSGHFRNSWLESGMDYGNWSRLTVAGRAYAELRDKDFNKS